MIQEELLKPRYEVIADYPNNEKYKVGDILQLETTGGVSNTLTDDNYVDEYESFFITYPHLFRKLEWWEKRDIKDMPEYVKCTQTPDQLHFPNEVYKVKWIGYSWGESEKGTIVTGTNCYIPATLEEYTNYINPQPPTS